VGGLKHQKEKRSMEHFAGLDVSVKDTSVCIVDNTGKIAREVKVASEPDALLAAARMSARLLLGKRELRLQTRMSMESRAWARAATTPFSAYRSLCGSEPA
jgi:hypothetical protein